MPSKLHKMYQSLDPQYAAKKHKKYATINVM